MSTLRILVISPEAVGETMAGPAIRALEIARALAAEAEVTLMAPRGSALKADPIKLFEGDAANPQDAYEAAKVHDVLISQPLSPAVVRGLLEVPTRLVFDLYDPTPIEVLEHHKGLAVSEQNHAAAVNTDAVRMAMLAGDFLVCASEKQRDLWIGGMLMHGMVTPRLYQRDPSLRSLIDVVPFGIAKTPPRGSKKVLKGVVPGIKASDKVILWGGGLWTWFDGLSVVKAVEKLSRQRPDVKLYFLGVKRPAMGAGEVNVTAQEVIRYADSQGLTGKSVFFNEGWVPYAERRHYLAEADIGVSTHFDNLEMRFSFRTRIVDYIWAGLPIVATEGDSFAELIERHQLGFKVGFEDVEGLAKAFATIIDDKKSASSFANHAKALRPDFYWDKVIAPIREFIKDLPRRPKDEGSIRRLAQAQKLHGIRKSYAEGGAVGVLRKTAEKSWPKKSQ